MPTRVRFRVEGADGEEVEGRVRALAERVASLEVRDIAGQRVLGALEWGKGGSLPAAQRAVRVGFELLPQYDYPPQAEIHQRRAAEAFGSLRDAHARDEAVRVRLGGRRSRLQAVEVKKVSQMARRVVVDFMVEPPQQPAEVPLEELGVIALRRELRRRKVGELRRLAADAGCSDDELREAFESNDDPKGAVVALLVTHYAKLAGHVLEEPSPELSVPTLVRVKVVEGRQLKSAAPFNLSRHRDHDAYVEVQLFGKDGEAIPHGRTPAALNAGAAVRGHSTPVALRGHVSDFGGAEIGNKPRQQELREMRVFALQQICMDRNLDATVAAGGKAELVRRILEAEALADAEGRRIRDAEVSADRSTRDNRHGERDSRHARSNGDDKRGNSGDRTRGVDDVPQFDGELDSTLSPVAGYSATTFRRSAAWKSTIVHQSADPVRHTHTNFARHGSHWLCCVFLGLRCFAISSQLSFRYTLSLAALTSLSHRVAGVERDHGVSSP